MELTETNSIGFEDFVDDVIEKKSTEYPDLKTVVIDTYDQLVEIAKPEVIRMHNAENPEKPVKSIKAAFGGYMAGEDKANEIVLDKLWELKTVGVHFIIIGHVKQRIQEDVTTGQTYTSLTTNMSIRDFSAIKTKLHFLGVASIDREIVQEKTGKTKKEGKKDVDIMKGVITSESRKITFRDDSYSIDSKSRFADIVPEIEFNCDALIKALTDAIKAEAERCGMYYVNQRWLGGMLTNFKTIESRIARLKAIEKMSEDGTFEVLPKKEVIELKKEWEKLEKNLGGIKDMKRIPDAIFIVDPKKERICVQEAHILGIPLIGIADTNCDPEELDYVIPGNDDAIRAVKLIVSKMADAVIEAKQGADAETTEAEAAEADAE